MSANDLLMPKSTAIWLYDNTLLTFEQIGAFCNLDPAEIEAIADATVSKGLVSRNPMQYGELTQEEIKRCEDDSTASLVISTNDLPSVKSRSKGPKYTPISKRGDKPDAIAFLIKQHPEVTDPQIVKLVGTTKKTIQSIRDRAHANMQNIKPRHPADIGLCSYTEFDKFLEKCRAKAEKEGRYTPPAVVEEETVFGISLEEKPAQSQKTSGFDFSNFLGSTGTD